MGGYSTISLGYAGLCECVRYMTGKSHTDPSATPFALEIMRYMNAACDRWKAETSIGFGIYGTPLELRFEAQFQALSTGGAISYVEVPNMQQNLEAVLQIIRFIYDNIMYAELNTKSDYCQLCGWDGEIEIREEDGKLVWTCPQCGNQDQNTMNVARRTCGYIGTQFWNQGRTQEIKERVMHL